MNTKITPGAPLEDPSKRELVDFRDLETFREVYQEKSHVIRGSANRKSVMRTLANLERAFECTLFLGEEKGRLIPSPFAERLFNDLRFLESAQAKLEDHVRQVHDAGRVLHVGSSPAVFRTHEFRTLFRGLQMTHGVRPSFSPVEASQAGRALASGQCDLYFGFWMDDVTRFATQEAGHIHYRAYERLPNSRKGQQENPSPECYVVSLEGDAPVPPPTEPLERWKTLTDQQWLAWLDHPEKCPPGTRVLGPDVQVDGDYWRAGEEDGVGPRPLQATWLRQHSYEFLPGLIGKLRNRS